MVQNIHIVTLFLFLFFCTFTRSEIMQSIMFAFFSRTGQTMHMSCLHIKRYFCPGLSTHSFQFTCSIQVWWDTFFNGLKETSATKPWDMDHWIKADCNVFLGHSGTFVCVLFWVFPVGTKQKIVGTKIFCSTFLGTVCFSNVSQADAGLLASAPGFRFRGLKESWNKRHV